MRLVAAGLSGLFLLGTVYVIDSRWTVISGIDPGTGKNVPVKVSSDGTVATSGGGGGGGGGATFTNDGSTAQLGRVQDTDTGAGTHYTPEAILVTPGNGGPVQTGTSGNPLRTDPTGATTQPISASSLPLPVGAAQEHATAGSPNACRLSDGAAFYDGAKTGQLPAALDGLNLKVHEQGSVGVTGTFWPTAAGSPGSLELSDGSAFYTGAKTGQLPAALVGGRLDVNVGAALPAGANVIGHVIADTGSTTAVTQATGTNLHAVIDTGSTTAVTQATASNLNAQVQGAGASGAAKAGNPVQIGAVFNTTQPTVTTGQGVEAQATARGAQIVAVGVDGFAVTGTVTTTPPSNASTNVAQLAGTTTDTNSGVKSAGTLRVVIATDQPALTNKLLVTPDSVALPANQSVNAAQFGGTNVSTGTGAGGAGIPRVTVSNDSTVGLVAGSAIVGKVGIDQTTLGTTNGVTAVPTTAAGAATTTKVVAVNTTTNVKASAGNVYGMSCLNANASACFIQFYNTSGSPACGTSVIWYIAMPTSGVVQIPPGAMALANHATGIGVCMGTTATGATACTTANSCTFFYQ